LPINLCHDFREWPALRQASIDALDPALDLIFPRGFDVIISSRFAFL
jgi:hypothetical protein